MEVGPITAVDVDVDLDGGSFSLRRTRRRGLGNYNVEAMYPEEKGDVPGASERHVDWAPSLRYFSPGTSPPPIPIRGPSFI